MSGENNAALSSAEMEARLRYLTEMQHVLAPNSIGDILAFQVESFCPEDLTFRFSCKTFPWMRNAAGTLHGGMGATAVDQAMGYAVRGMLPDEAMAVTAQMQTAYHRPLNPGEDVGITVKVLQKTGSLIHLTADAFQQERPDKLCISATAIYYYR